MRRTLGVLCALALLTSLALTAACESDEHRLARCTAPLFHYADTRRDTLQVLISCQTGIAASDAATANAVANGAAMGAAMGAASAASSAPAYRGR